MIEINLLPGAGKKARRLGMSSGLSSAFSGISGQVKDPYMIGAIASAVICLVAVGTLFAGHKTAESTLLKREAVAVNDSAKYSSVILQKRRAEARRDSVMRQVKLIQAIDNDRYVWPHVLAEVSKSLPPFTWLGSVAFINPITSPAAAIPIDSAALATALSAADTAAILKPTSASPDKREAVRFEIMGYTVDVQAMTRFIRDMEVSPFIHSIQLVDSKSVVVGTSIVTEFILRGEFEAPAEEDTRRVTLSSAVR
jgi:Tfp pilus assembly protein PilN